MNAPDGGGLRARTVQAFMLLGAQRAMGLLVTVAGGIVLARLLMPEVFGVYAIILFAVGLGMTFGDLGLGATLTQRRDLDLDTNLRVAFTVHVGLTVGLGATLAIAAPAIVNLLGLSPDADRKSTRLNSSHSQIS